MLLSSNAILWLTPVRHAPIDGPRKQRKDTRSGPRAHCLPHPLPRHASRCLSSLHRYWPECTGRSAPGILHRYVRSVLFQFVAKSSTKTIPRCGIPTVAGWATFYDQRRIILNTLFIHPDTVCLPPSANSYYAHHIRATPFHTTVAIPSCLRLSNRPQVDSNIHTKVLPLKAKVLLTISAQKNCLKRRSRHNHNDAKTIRKKKLARRPTTNARLEPRQHTSRPPNLLKPAESRAKKKGTHRRRATGTLSDLRDAAAQPATGQLSR